MSDEEVDKYELQLYNDNILHRIRYIKRFYGFTLTREQFLNEWNIIKDDMRILKRKKLIHRFLKLNFFNISRVWFNIISSIHILEYT